MKVQGDYARLGYAHVERLVSPDVTKVLLQSIWSDLHGAKLPASVVANSKVLNKAAMELHGSTYQPLTSFLWGLTPLASQLAGCDLLPTYCFFRLYQKGDQLKVHADRNACEHSLSLSLGYGDGIPWPFEVGPAKDGQTARPAEDFGDEPFSSIVMNPGDAVLYRGIACRHGRTTPNPNGWSAHLFLHWVDADGPYSDLAFEKIGQG